MIRNGSLTTRRNGGLETWVLAVSFFLVIVGFLMVVLLAEREAQGIGAYSRRIVSEAAPKIDHLTNARTELRTISSLARIAQTPKDQLESFEFERLKNAMAKFGFDWQSFLQTPQLPEGKKKLQSSTEQVLKWESSVNAMANTYENGSRQDTARRAAIVLELSHDIDTMIELHIEETTAYISRLALEIESRRIQSRRTAFILSSGVGFFAIVGAFAVIRMTRRINRFMSSRITELDHFAIRMAHDIRNPLAVTMMALDLLHEKGALDAAGRNLADQAMRSTKRTSQIVESLLTFARSSGTIEPNKRGSTSLGESIAGVVEELAPVAKENYIDLVSERIDQVQVTCGPGVLTSLLSNLVGNAIKFMGTSLVRRITLRTVVQNNRARVEIEDTGPGLTHEQLVSLFEPFVRATTSEVPGLGLGLATVKRLAEAHGGSVGVSSSIGKGSLFWFELPTTHPS